MLKKQIKTTELKWNTSKFRKIVDDHVNILREKSTGTTVDAGVGMMFANNLYGLLYSLNIQPKYHYAIMRVNKISNPRVCGDIRSLLIPDNTYIDKLMSIEETKERISV